MIILYFENPNQVSRVRCENVDVLRTGDGTAIRFTHKGNLKIIMLDLSFNGAVTLLKHEFVDLTAYQFKTDTNPNTICDAFCTSDFGKKIMDWYNSLNSKQKAFLIDVNHEFYLSCGRAVQLDETSVLPFYFRNWTQMAVEDIMHSIDSANLTDDGPGTWDASEI